MSSNAAAEWPDWRGETAVIVATGPSAADAPLAAAQGRARVIVIKASWGLAPWADVLYGCDREWWIANQGCAKFRGLKVSPSPSVCRVYGIKQVKLVARASILMDEIGRIGCGVRTGGGHSGFHALNLAAQFGAKRIVLVGFDMRVDHGWHWHDKDRHPDPRQMREHAAALDACADEFKDLRIEVLNASPISALTAYRKVSLLEALAWR